jgi:hypothetical protein
VRIVRRAALVANIPVRTILVTLYHFRIYRAMAELGIHEIRLRRPVVLVDHAAEQVTLWSFQVAIADREAEPDRRGRH